MAAIRRYILSCIMQFPDAFVDGLRIDGWRGAWLACCVFVLRAMPVEIRMSPSMIIRTWHEAANYVDNFVQAELRNDEVEQLLRDKGGMVVELGVNVGITARWWLSLGSGVRVTGIDMIQEALDYTRDHLAELSQADRASFIAGAVGSSPGEIEISFDDPLMGTNSIGSTGGVKRKVRLDTVDAFMAGDRHLEPIQLLKIDIEGHGAEALRGASGTLARTQWVVIETHHAEELQTSAQLLTAGGFALSAFRGRTMWWKRGA